MICTIHHCFFQQGYYADPDTECQAFHVCTADGQGGLSKNSFLCPNGTIFNQNYFICDWWFNFECSEAEGLYSLNDKIAAEREELAAAASDVQSTYSAAPAAPAPASYAQPQAAPVAPPAPQANYEQARAGRSRSNTKPLGPRFNKGF